MDTSDTSSDTGGQWVSIRAAADLLTVTPRTIHRRLKSGDLAGRMHHGRREVWIPECDTVATGQTRRVTPNIPECDTVASVTALSVFAERAVAVAEHELQDARRELRTAKRTALAGWIGAVATLTAGGTVAAIQWNAASLAERDAETTSATLDQARQDHATALTTERQRAEEAVQRAEQLSRDLAAAEARAEVLAAPWRMIADTLNREPEADLDRTADAAPGF